MVQVKTTKLGEFEKYSHVLISLRVPYKIETDRVESADFPIEEIEVLNLPPFSHRGFRTQKESQLIIKITQDTTIIRCLPIQLFSYARTYDQALNSFKSLLIDYYTSLKRRKRTLGKNLLRELEYLESIIVNEKTKPRKDLQKQIRFNSY